MKNVKMFDFQLNAVNELRDNIDMAHAAWNVRHSQQVISFSAPTGSGKTIIMTQLFEQILFGDATHGADLEARFIWLSDSPELNEQTRLKIESKSDLIKVNQLVDVDQYFGEEELEAGKIYFVNTQKLGSGKQLVTLSDSRANTFWTIVDNTAKAHPEHLYLIIDEAHRGTKTDREAKAAQSIMQKFIYGSEEDGINALPLIIGMSATARRFETLIKAVQSTLNRVSISAAEVRESGLLKDDVILNYPDLSFTPDMAMMEAAASDWAEKRFHWFIHNKNNGEAFIEPILIVQVEDGDDKNPTKSDIGGCLKIIEERAHVKLHAGNVAHTFNDFGELNVNGIPIYYVEPSRIQENLNIQVVFFKMNLSTGWDCPRAETIMSFRHATDATYIAQLLGRMVRTPMARRIPEDEVLNNVNLYLPHFDDDTVNAVINALKDNDSAGETVTNITTSKKTAIYYAEDPDTEDKSVSAQQTSHTFELETQSVQEPTYIEPEQPSKENGSASFPEVATGRRDTSLVDIPVDPRAISNEKHHAQIENDVTIQTINHSSNQLNPAVERSAFNPVNQIKRGEIIKAVNRANLTSYKISSHRQRSGLKNLFSLARLLSRSKIYTEANENAISMVIEKMHTFIAHLKECGKYQEEADEYRRFELRSTTIDAFGEKHEKIENARKMITTDADIEKQYYLACGKLGEGIGGEYLKKFADVDDIVSAELEVVVFVNNISGMTELEASASKMYSDLYDTYRPAIVSSNNRKLISDLNDISGLSSDAAPIIYSLPTSADFPENGHGIVYSDHLYCKNGYIRIDLNAWEAGVIAEEEKRPDFVCWLRNIDRKDWALCIPYQMNGSVHAAYPDIIVFRKRGFSDYIIDILEPHLPSDKDNVYKARGFAEYAESNQNSDLGRLQLIRLEKAADGKAHFKRLDVNRLDIRNKVLKISSNAELDNLFDSFGVIDF